MRALYSRQKKLLSLPLLANRHRKCCRVMLSRRESAHGFCHTIRLTLNISCPLLALLYSFHGVGMKVRCVVAHGNDDVFVSVAADPIAYPVHIFLVELAFCYDILNVCCLSPLVSCSVVPTALLNSLQLFVNPLFVITPFALVWECSSSRGSTSS